MTFDFPQRIAHMATTRRVRAGSIVCSGTVSNLDRSRGYCCIAEKRSLDMIAGGSATTPFMKFGARRRAEPEAEKDGAMSKNDEFAMGLPFPGMIDGLDLVRKLWGASGMPAAAGMAQAAHNLPQSLPSMIAPTLDVGELDKRIADLRAVEQWLNLNVNMLHATIQSLEVQRNTIATLQSFGGAMLSTMTTPADRPSASTASKPVATPLPSPRPPASKSAGSSESSPPATTIPLNPAAWWNTLQEQFTRVAAAAAAQPEKTPPKARKAPRSKRPAQ